MIKHLDSIDSISSILLISIILIPSFLFFHFSGILWAGRGQVRKSLLYLLSVKKMYNDAIALKKEQNSNSNSNSKLILDKLKKSFWIEADLICTHNLFYLAQAYGKYGLS